MVALISTPAERLEEASKKFEKLCTMLLSSDAWEQVRTHKDRDVFFGTHNVIFHLMMLEIHCRMLSRAVAIVDEENTRLCKHLAAVVTSRQERQERQARRLHAATEAAGRTPTKGTFSWFSNLPAELRLLIWEAACQPPRCQHIVSILKTARAPNEQEAAAGAVQMTGAHPCDPAGLLYHEDDLGLWTACRESRAVVQRVHANAHAELIQARQAGHCSCFIDTKRLEMQCRRVGRFNREGIAFQDSIHLVDDGMKHYYITAEHRHRQLAKIQAQIGAQTGVQVDNSVGAGSGKNEQKKKENIIADVLRELYELEGNFPESADDGAIPFTVLKRRCLEMNIGYLLGVPWVY